MKKQKLFRDTKILSEPQGRGQQSVSKILEPGGRRGKEVHFHLLSPCGRAQVLEAPVLESPATDRPTDHGIFSAQARTGSWALPSSSLALPLTGTRSWKSVGWSFHLPSLSSLETGPPRPSDHVAANCHSKMRNVFLGSNFKFPRKGL